MDMVRIFVRHNKKELNPKTHRVKGFNLFGSLANIQELGYSLRATEADARIPKRVNQRDGNSNERKAFETEGDGISNR